MAAIGNADGLPPEDIQVQNFTLQSGDRIILTCDGVWEGIDLNDRRTQEVLATADRGFAQDVSSGMDRGAAANRVWGYIFQNINLSGFDGRSTEELTAYLTRPEVGNFSRDNVTAIVAE